MACLRVEAEQATDISEHYAVASVPLLLFCDRGAEVDRLEGADPAALTTKFRTLAGAAASAPFKSVGGAAAAPSQRAEGDAMLHARLTALVRQSPVMLFMKGSPQAPQCGFSARVVGALRAAGAADFGSFDILTDEAVRQGMKAFSQWPTFPQLYVNGELLGGCDIVLEMAASGELKAELSKAKALAPPAAAAPPAVSAGEEPEASNGSAGDAMHSRLEALVNSQRVMLFMKGECGRLTSAASRTPAKPSVDDEPICHAFFVLRAPPTAAPASDDTLSSSLL